MRKTIADMFREEGERRGIEEGERRGIEEGERRGIEEGERRGRERQLVSLRKLLLELFQKHSYKPDAETLSAIEQCQNPEQLHDWFRSAIEAENLNDVRFQNAN